jgi:hypothetical protein
VQLTHQTAVSRAGRSPWCRCRSRGTWAPARVPGCSRGAGTARRCPRSSWRAGTWLSVIRLLSGALRHGQTTVHMQRRAKKTSNPSKPTCTRCRQGSTGRGLQRSCRWGCPCHRSGQTAGPACGQSCGECAPWMPQQPPGRHEFRAAPAHPGAGTAGVPHATGLGEWDARRAALPEPAVWVQKSFTASGHAKFCRCQESMPLAFPRHCPAHHSV